MKPVIYKDLSPSKKKQVRESYVAHQEGKCWHCQQPLSGPSGINPKELPLDMRRFPPHFLRWSIHLHHSHKTGLTIGAVHAYCNGVLWQYHGQ